MAKHFAGYHGRPGSPWRRAARPPLWPTSAVSSVGDNGSAGGTHCAADGVESIHENCAIEFARKKHPVAFLLLHLGTVDGPPAPFLKERPEGKLFKVNFSAERLLGIVGDKTQADTGKFSAWMEMRFSRQRGRGQDGRHN